MSPRRRRGLTALLVTGAALLSGCVSVPGDGPVIPADKVERTDRQRVGFISEGPSAGAGPVDLVRGFLLAGNDFTDDHATARKFLQAGPGPRLRWRPEGPVVVYPRADDLKVYAGEPPDPTPTPTPAVTPAGSPTGTASRASTGAPTTTSTSATTTSTKAASTPSAATPTPTPTPHLGDTAKVTVTVPVHALVDQSGQYTMAAGEIARRTFRLTYTDEGWRISTLGDGILLNQSEFRSIFQSMPVYFADRQGAYLVPDLRWFPVNAASTPAAVVSTVLSGPASWLLPAVENVVPKGTQSTVNGVKVVDEVATVDLTKQARDADARQRRVLKRQLDETLTGDRRVVQVSRVTVTVEQQVYEMQPSPAGSNDAPVNGDATGLRRPSDVTESLVALDAKGAIVRVAGESVQPVKELAGLTSPTNAFPATEPGGGAYAVLAADRTKLVYAVPDGAPKLLLMGAKNLTAPSFDPYGWVWSAQEDARGSVFASVGGNVAIRVGAAWLGNARVRSLRLSREGARAVLVVVPPGGTPQVVVCAVVRDGDGRPTGLGQPLRLLVDAQDVTGAAWTDATHVAVLARRPGQADLMPWIVELGGDVEGTIPVSGVVSVAVSSSGQLWVTAPNGAVQRRSFSSWEAVPGVRYPAMPG